MPRFPTHAARFRFARGFSDFVDLTAPFEAVFGLDAFFVFVDVFEEELVAFFAVERFLVVPTAAVELRLAALRAEPAVRAVFFRAPGFADSRLARKASIKSVTFEGSLVTGSFISLPLSLALIIFLSAAS